MLALSVMLWAEGAIAMLSAAGYTAQCHAKIPPMRHQGHSMPCCPPDSASVPSSFFQAPPCCDLSSQPAQPPAFIVMSGKVYSGELIASSAAGAMIAPPVRRSAFRSQVNSPPFKPVFDLKTDLRI
jgi:hypothetical protein